MIVFAVMVFFPSVVFVRLFCSDNSVAIILFLGVILENNTIIEDPVAMWTYTVVNEA